MDQTTYFSFRCAACNGRSRVASRHVGQTIVCPYCQVHGAALPDVRPTIVPVPRDPQPQRVDAAGNPVTTSRVARPLVSTTTATVRRPQPPAAPQVQQAPYGADLQVHAHELFADDRGTATATRSYAPGMVGFEENRALSPALAAAPAPGTASVRRTAPGTATIERSGTTATHARQPGSATIARNAQPGRAPAMARAPAQTPLLAAVAATVILALFATWAVTDANSYRSRYMQARAEIDRGAAQLTDIQATADTLDKRLARAQIELAAAQAAVLRERELVADLNKAVGRLSDDLAKAARIEAPGLSSSAASSALASAQTQGGFPVATLPTAGVPAARRDGLSTTPIRNK